MKLLLFLALSALVVGSATAGDELRLREDNIDEIVRHLTLEEKAHLVVGANISDRKSAGEIGYLESIVPGAAGITYPILRLGIPSIVLADGPAGLRINPTRPDDAKTYYCTGFPVGTLLAATWNDEIVHRVGEGVWRRCAVGSGREYDA